MTDEWSPLISGKERGASDNKFNRFLDRACIVSGYLNDALLFGGMLIGGYIPILPPTTSVEDVHEHYVKWDRGLRICATFWILTGITYPFFTSGVSKQLRRTPGISPVLVNAWNMSSVVVNMIILATGLWMCQAGYRLDRSPEVISALHDIIIIYIVIPFTPLAVQAWVVALAVYQDYAGDKDPSPSRHLYPKWVGWFNFVAPIIQAPAIATHFVYHGPLAWNGILAFWIPAIAFGIQVNVMSYASLNAIDKVLDHEKEIFD